MCSLARSAWMRRLRLSCAFVIGVQAVMPCAVLANQKKPTIMQRVHDYISPARPPKKSVTRVKLSGYEFYLMQSRIQSVLSSQPGFAPKNAIITPREWRELQLDWLLEQLDRAQTNFGRFALTHMLMPSADLAEIERRQAMIKMLIEDDVFFCAVRDALTAVHQSEEDVLSYWVQQDQLRANARNLYWHLPGSKRIQFVKKLNTFLNTHAKTLDLGNAVDYGKSLNSFWFGMFQSSFMRETAKWMAGFGGKISVESLFLGHPKDIIFGHIPFTKYFSVDGDPRLAQILSAASLARLKQPGGYRLGRALIEQGLLPQDAVLPYCYDPEQFTFINTHGTFADKVFSIAYGQREEGGGLYFNTLAKLLNWMNVTTNWDGCIPGTKWEPQGGPKAEITWKDNAKGLITTTAFLIWDDWNFWESMQSSARNMGTLQKTSDGLRDRLMSVAQFLHSAQKLERIVKPKDGLYGTQFADHLQLLGKKDASAELKELIGLLGSSTFKGGRSMVYSRGTVLRAHSLCVKIKEELAPAIHAIAELDAYLSMATLLRETRGQKVGWTFAQFAAAEWPFIDAHDAWLGVLDPLCAVTNDVTFGTRNCPTKIIITGPNGGGKSTYLKTVGHLVVLAQSWGIVPATDVTMTLFNGVRTVLRSDEDLPHGMSTFMAEKRDMDVIQQFVSESSHDKRVLVLADEPYRGTVDAESADRIYQFGKDVAPFEHALVFVATHVYKPVLLAHDTHDIFGNYQVAINELPMRGGMPAFARLYQLKPGHAAWWFDEADKRSRFIDWLGAQGRL